VKGNSQSSNNPSIRKEKKEQSRKEMKSDEVVGSKSLDDPDEHQIEHRCDTT
jgi:hypothetical protein